MARSKEFDPEKALRQSIELFWKQGYARTSLDDLMKAMGIARQSLYDTFGDKRRLYIRALELYRDDTLAATRAHFPASRPIRESFRAHLTAIAQESRTRLQRGCLLLSASLELEPQDKEIAELLLDYQQSLEAIFREALERAQQDSEISRKKDAAGLARFFNATIQGMRILGRVEPKRKLLESIAETALAAL
jgi:TetR/AcrR family transcriptional repressor of nem operon